MKSEKPIECTSCKKKSTVTYREIKDSKITTTSYCADCPMLKAKMAVNVGEKQDSLFDSEKKIACSECKTTLHDVMTGAPFGCKKCYETFEDFLTQELSSLGAIPASNNSTEKELRKMPLHLGNVPSKAKSPDFSNKLRSLNSALHEALATEHYERAANLRDQIKLLMDQSYKGASD